MRIYIYIYIHTTHMKQYLTPKEDLLYHENNAPNKTTNTLT